MKHYILAGDLQENSWNISVWLFKLCLWCSDFWASLFCSELLHTLCWCVSEISDAGGQGYCQGGFSADFTTVTTSLLLMPSSAGFFLFCFHALNYKSFLSQDGKVVLGGPGSFYWQGRKATLVTEKMWWKKCIGIHEAHRVLVCFLGQVISAAKEDIIKAYYPGYFMQSVQNQIQTKQGPPKHDDSYQGKRVTVLSLTMHNIAQYYFLLFTSFVLLVFHVFALTHRLLCRCWGVHRRSGGRWVHETAALWIISHQLLNNVGLYATDGVFLLIFCFVSLCSS